MGCCSRSATTARAPNAVNVAFATRWYSVFPAPMIRTSRERMAASVLSHSTPIATP